MTMAWICFALLGGWFVFGIIVVVMIVYGMFDHVALGPAVMAAIVGTGASFLAAWLSLAIILTMRRSRAVSQPDRHIRGNPRYRDNAND